MPAALIIDPGMCTACMACELACSFSKAGVFSPSMSRIRIVRVHTSGVNVPVACVNCEAAPCIDVCPTEAISRSGDLGIVRVDEARCDGCELCVDECPYGAVRIPFEGSVAAMCDLCDGHPRCVSECIYGALRFDGRPDTTLTSLDVRALPGVGEERLRALAMAVATRARGQGGRE